MPRQTTKVQIFDSEDMSTNPVFMRCINANVGFYVQFDFSGATGDPVATFYSSSDGVNWVRRNVKDPDTCKPLPNISLSGGSGSDAFEVDTWRADWVKIEITGATAGTISALMDYQENNNTY